MVKIDWAPKERQLRQFGWIGLVGFPLLGWVVSHKTSDSADLGVWIIFGFLAFCCGVFAWLKPKLLRPLYLAMMCIAAVIGPIVAFIVLSILFFLVFLPMALVFKIIGRDALHRSYQPDAESYWVKSDPPGNPASYYRQF